LGILSIAATNVGIVPFHGLPVAPIPHATTPVPFRKTHVRHGGDELAATAAGFRLRSAAALRYGSVPAVSPPALHCFRSPTADRSLIGQMDEADSISMGVANEVVSLSRLRPDHRGL